MVLRKTLRNNVIKTLSCSQSLKEIDITTLTDKQIANAVKFVKTVGDDEKTGLTLHLR
jgi:hypothetical protein